MSESLFHRILRSHGLDPDAPAIPLMPDQILMHDATATPVCLQLEAAGVDSVRPRTYVYCDHNTLQVGYRNADDHRYLRGMAARLGMAFSKVGNGICHQLHLEEAALPGGVLLGADSHTPMAGSLGMLAIGAGGMDIATALAGEAYMLPRPRLVGVRLEGSLPPWCSGKDIILHVLRLISVKGGIGRVFEYYGPGLAGLSVFDRATICNMGAECGATTSIFPSDANTRDYLTAFGRQKDWRELTAGEDAAYDERITIDLSALEPLIALPHSPDAVRPVAEVEGTKLTQVCIGSCTNASYKDIATAASVFRGKRLPEDLEVSVSPGSRRTLAALLQDGHVNDLTESGARLLECTCGPCNGVGMSPCSEGVSLRTFNRNFKGRSGTSDAAVYLASPETAAASALSGYICDPRRLGDCRRRIFPSAFPSIPDILPLPAAPDPDAQAPRGPNIKPMPVSGPLPERLALPVELKAGDDITTDHLLPGGAEMLSLRSNVPDSVPYVFQRLDPEFAARAGELPEAWAVVGGRNFGQGSSREHAVMVPMSIGMKMVIALSMARIFRKNLINNGVIPLIFEKEDDYAALKKGDSLLFDALPEHLASGRVRARINGGGESMTFVADMSAQELEILRAGGMLNWLKSRKG